MIKTIDDRIFGGYTEATWNSSSGIYKFDKNAFIFYFKKSSNQTSFAKIKSGENAIYCNGGYGPTFGGGHDLHVTSDFSRVQLNLGSSYEYSYEIANRISSGYNSGYNGNRISLSFQIEEVEVFQLK